MNRSMCGRREDHSHSRNHRIATRDGQISGYGRRASKARMTLADKLKAGDNA
jgi:hypothetical protein